MTDRPDSPPVQPSLPRFTLWSRIRARLAFLILAIGIVYGVPNDTPKGNTLGDKVLGKAKDHLFNYVAWEIGAISSKINQLASGLAPYLTEPERSDYVVDYLKNVADLETIESRIANIYSDPAVRDPELASTELRQQRDDLRNTVELQQPTAEAIIETQVASVLHDEGFSMFGEIIPPLSAHITELPELLVISPRNKIEYTLAVNTANQSVSENAALESSIQKDLDVSAIVVPIGGLGLYPTMVIQTWSANYLFDTFAHEWSHNYLIFFPLGLNYGNGETRIINESTATLFGNEVGRKTLLRYYANYPQIMRQIPPEERPANNTNKPVTPTITPTPLYDPEERTGFNGAAFMNETRITTDFLLSLGKIDQAERYMEGQRLVFAAYGYRYRKINQAFFAFYGGYQGAGGSSAGGGDPIGDALATLRKNSPSLKAWMEQMRGITTRDELLAAAGK